MDFVEMDNEQRRQLIDVQQAYSSWRPAKQELDGLGSMHWQSTKGIRYLIDKRGTIRKSLGRESTELIKKKTDFETRKKVTLLENQ